MANFEVIGQKYPGGGDTSQERLIFIDNGDGTFTFTVSSGDGTYPSKASSIVAGSGIFVQGATGQEPGGAVGSVQYNLDGVHFGGIVGATTNGTVLTLAAGDLVLSDIKPPADSTTAIQIKNAAGSTTLVTVDTTNGFMGIGVSPPAGLVDVAQNGAAMIQITAYRAAVNAGNLTLNHARGTQALPAALLANDRAGTIFFQGWNANGSFVETGELAFIQTDAVNGSAHGKFQFATGSGPSVVLAGTTLSTGTNDTPSVGIGINPPVSSTLDVRASQASQTGTWKIVQGLQTGTFDTTAGALTSYGGFFQITSSRAAGANSLTNIGLYATASGAQVNLAAQFDATVQFAQGTATIPPINIRAASALETTPAAGDIEYDGVNSYITNDTTSGRGIVPVEQFFRLNANGGTISTIANFFGATSNISLVANAIYEIEIDLWFLNTTAGTVTFTLTNSASPTSQNIHYEESPITGLVGLPGTATMLVADVFNDATAAFSGTTGTLTDAANHHVRFRIILKNGAGTSLKIQATKNVGGTITPGIGSRWFCKRLSPNNVGSFAA